MWITQSYLATVEPDAKVFIYYLFEDYNPEQTQFTQDVQREMEKMGEIHNNNVSLLMPNPNYANKIEGEVRQIRPLWEHINGTLPALLISTTPMAKIDENTKHCVYIPFKDATPEAVVETIQQARTLTEETLLKSFEISNQNIKRSWKQRLGESIQLKPSLFGIGIDLKEIFRKYN